MARYVRRLAALIKIEPTYGVDAVPTGAANAIQFNNVTMVPLAGEQVSRDLLLPYLGNQGVILTGTHGTLQGEVELAGAGVAGTAPAWGPLLRACGFAQVITAGVKVDYNPISTAFEAISIYYNLDGVRHVLLGCRGTVTLALVPRQIPRLTFNFTGLKGEITDLALPVVDLTKFTKPVAVSKANTTFTLHGLEAITESLNIDVAATIETRFLIGHESVQLTDRQTTATAVVEASSLAIKNWFAIAEAHTAGAFAAEHGKTAGNIVAITAPAVQIGRPTQGVTQGIANYSLPLMLLPVVGNDEMIIGVR